MLTENKIKELEVKANEIRESIISMLLEAGSGHTAGPLGMAGSPPSPFGSRATPASAEFAQGEPTSGSRISSRSAPRRPTESKDGASTEATPSGCLSGWIHQ